jgi:hypothetical protein
MTNIEKCKAALAQGLRVQHCNIDHWHTMAVLDFDDVPNRYRIHPDDEAKFVEPSATPARHVNLSTRTINGRTYTHRCGTSLCRIVCADIAHVSGVTLAVALLCDDEATESVLCTKPHFLTPGTDPAFDVDWSKVAIDAPLWGHGSHQPAWQPGHFAGLDSQGRVTVFDGGRTSHTTDQTTIWQAARLTKPE